MRERRLMSHASLLSCLCLILGCGDSGPVLKVVPVHGTVTIDGQAKQYVRVGLIPCDKGDSTPVATAMTDENGEFKLKTNVEALTRDKKQTVKSFEGVEPGEYFISFSYLQPINPRGADPEFGDELLPKKYVEPYASGLKELRITIQDSETELPQFELKRR